MEINGKNRFASQGVLIAQMMYVSKYKSHKIALFNSMKKSNIAPISATATTATTGRGQQLRDSNYSRTMSFVRQRLSVAILRASVHCVRCARKKLAPLHLDDGARFAPFFINLFCFELLILFALMLLLILPYD